MTLDCSVGGVVGEVGELPGILLHVVEHKGFALGFWIPHEGPFAETQAVAFGNSGPGVLPGEFGGGVFAQKSIQTPRNKTLGLSKNFLIIVPLSNPETINV